MSVSPKARAAAWLGAAAFAACGGVEPEPALAVQISNTSALEGADAYEIRIFGKATQCGALREDPVRTRTYNGVDCDPAVDPNCLISVWSIEPEAGRGRILEVPVGAVTVSVIAIDANQAPVGQGCVAEVAIEEGVATAIEVRLDPIP